MKARFSRARLVTAAVLALWAALFWFVIATGRAPLYFSSRTTWLAPVGAALLTFAAIGRLASARVGAAEPISARSVRAIAVLIVPPLLIMVFPPATLGSFAVSRRANATTAGYAASGDVDLGKDDLSLLDIFFLRYSGELHKLASRAGRPSSFTGFVTRAPGDGAGEFRLNRFAITCCPGDAVTIQLRVVGAPPGRFETDSWVRVSGKLYPIGKEVVVDATEVVEVTRPKRPYLNAN